MFARQMGKNETSAHMEAFLLNRYMQRGGSIIKAAPTFRPQVVNSKIRLLQMLANPLNACDWWEKDGYMVGLGAARILFVSGNPEAQTVGLTASLALEIDEAQDFNEQKYSKDFRPMASSTNATTVMYGTAWTGDTLLEHQIALNKDLERKDGIRRHFEYDWTTLADMSDDYAKFVSDERTRLGEEHPLFRTQYKLQPITGQNRFITAQMEAQMHGNYAHKSEPTPGHEYVAGLDLAGEAEEDIALALEAKEPKRDSVVLTIAELDYSTMAPGIDKPTARIVEHYKWTGRKLPTLYGILTDILRNVWHVKRCAIDASGVGAGVASFLEQAIGATIVEQFVFTSQSKSALGYQLLAAINGGLFKMYNHADTTSNAADFWRQCQAARYEMRANQCMNFYVPEKDGHDDFVMSAALCARAADQVLITPVAAQIARQPDYQDGRY